LNISDLADIAVEVHVELEHGF